jgi:hypothetical protein
MAHVLPIETRQLLERPEFTGKERTFLCKVATIVENL